MICEPRHALGRQPAPAPLASSRVPAVCRQLVLVPLFSRVTVALIDRLAALVEVRPLRQRVYLRLLGQEHFGVVALLASITAIVQAANTAT